MKSTPWRNAESNLREMLPQVNKLEAPTLLDASHDCTGLGCYLLYLLSIALASSQMADVFSLQLLFVKLSRLCKEHSWFYNVNSSKVCGPLTCSAPLFGSLFIHPE